MDVPDWLQDFAAAATALTIVVTIILYVWQKTSAAKSEKQANRSRLTEAYMNVSAHVLSNNETISVASDLFNRGIEKFDQKSNKRETIIAIEILQLKLSALYLEWNYRKTYPESTQDLIADIRQEFRKILKLLGIKNDLPKVDEDDDDFKKTFDGTMRGFAHNGDPNCRKIIANLEEIFPGYPAEFMELMKKYFHLLDETIRVQESLHLQNLGDTFEGIKWLTDAGNTDNVKHVVNTVFYRYSADDPQSQNTFEQLPSVELAIKSLLDRKCIWEDIYIETQAATVKKMAIDLNPAQRSYYKSWRIKHGAVSSEFPLLQVMLVTYKSGISTVLFGWVFRGAHKDKVYTSSGPETTAYFMDYINKLKSNSEQVVLWETR